MSCAEGSRVVARLDGELAPGPAADVDRHLSVCPECRSTREAIEDTRALLSGARRFTAGPALRGRLAGALDREAEAPVPRPAARAGSRFWAGAASGFAVAAAAALAFLVVGRGPAPDAAVHDAVSAHLRALASGRTIDVASTDRHTVKPWFAGHADVSPPVADFAAEGFALVGGRIDYVDGRRAAVVVYRHGAHLIDVFAWRDPQARARARSAVENGYRAVRWQNGDLALCAVTDASEDTVAALRRLIDGTGAQAPRE